MSMYAFEEAYKVNEYEYGFLIDDSNVNDTTFKINVPTLMPIIPRTTSRVIGEYVSTNIFINDDKCKPSISPTVQTQNYLTVEKFYNTDLSHKAINGIIPSGTRFICAFINNNIRDIKLTGFI